MEMFRFANGLSSEDLLTQNAQNTPMAFHGTMWRFKNAKVNQKVREQAPQTPPPSQNFSMSGKLDPKNPMVKEAQDLGYELPPESIETEVETQGQGPESGLLTRDSLESMEIEDVKSFAAAVGVVNLNQKKDKLIKAILEKQQA